MEGVEGERRREKLGIPERGRISDRFLDNYVNANVLAGRSAANNVITESHYCTHAWVSCVPASFSRLCATVAQPLFSVPLARRVPRWNVKACKSALISSSFNFNALLSTSRVIDLSFLIIEMQRSAATRRRCCCKIFGCF